MTFAIDSAGRKIRIPAYRRCKTVAEKIRRRQTNIRRYKLKKYYGFTQEEYDAKLKEQDYKCAICRSADAGRGSDSFHIDHDHITNTIRGLLCCFCNLMIGNAKDNKEILQKGIVYLEKYVTN